jgi:predicted helicase
MTRCTMFGGTPSSTSQVAYEWRRSWKRSPPACFDGFIGTGTFLVRLLQSGLVKPEDIARKYASELHGNEILLLAYYIACVNIETTYAEITGNQEPFPGLILTDTFQSWEPDDRPDLNVFPENNARLEHLKSLPITVIVGNPPYSVGQDSANDNNANEKYPSLDGEIRRTYADTSTAANKTSSTIRIFARSSGQRLGCLIEVLLCL